MVAAGTKVNSGAAMKSQRSAAAGTTYSFVISLTASATHWRMPNGPARFGP